MTENNIQIHIINANDEEEKLYKNFLNSDRKKHKAWKISSNGQIYLCGKNKSIIVIKERTGEKNNLQDYITEVNTLLNLPKEFKNKLRIIGYSTINDEIDTIATEYIEGKKFFPQDFKLTSSVLSQFYEDLILLDKAEILHRDLHTSNLIAVANKYLKIIDYGASKTFSELKNLQKEQETKYKYPNFLPYMNIDSFEYYALHTYLLLKKPYSYEENNSNFLFEQHLALKSKYYEKQIEIYENKNIQNKKTILNNLNTLKTIYSKFTNNTLTDEEKNDILITEKLRIYLKQAQKLARSLKEKIKSSPYQNFLYWSISEGCYNKTLLIKTEEFIQKYYANKTLRKYFTLENKIAKFHYKNIFCKEYKKNLKLITEEEKQEIIELCEKEKKFGIIKTILQNENLLKLKNKNKEWTCIKIEPDELAINKY